MRASIIGLLLLAGAVPAVRAQDPARSIVERAIVAHGGMDKLSRARADRTRMRGIIYVGKTTVPFTSEVTVQLPKKYKMVLAMRESDKTRVVIHELDGDAVNITIDGTTQPAQGTHANQLRQTLELESAMRLVPLLDSKAFTLTALGEYKLHDRIVVGVGVKGSGQRELKMYFDKETALLVKTEQKIDGGDGKDVLQEAFYRDHREVGGYRRPGRAAAYRDGKKVLEGELIDAVRLDEK
jgi:hypothetical protein